MLQKIIKINVLHKEVFYHFLQVRMTNTNNLTS